MKISIITPTLNAESVIENAILSVKDQQYDDYEHIIMDAGSTDRTLEIVHKYDHLKCISKPDKGIYDAMNNGIEKAQGEWVYFMGADDSLHSTDVLKTISTEMVEPFEIVYGDVVSDRFNGRYGGEFDHERLLGNDNICHQAIFFNKRVFTKIGGFDLRYIAQSDWDHNLRWLFRTDIKSNHIDLIIANFADGGFSSVSGDTSFQKDKRFNYVKYGHTVLPWRKSMSLLYREVRVSVKTLNIRRLYLCTVLGLKICILKMGNRL